MRQRGTMESKVKLYSADDIKCDPDKREVVSIINSNAVDRDGEIVQPKGMRKKDFQGNPVVFANHSYAYDPKALPIGYCKWLKASTDANGNDIIIAKTYISDKTQEARDVFGLMQDGVLRAFSVGLQVNKQSKPTTMEINARPELKGCKNIVRDWSLLEYSVVGIPANQEALALAMSKGYSKKMLDMLSGKNDNTIKTAETIIEAVTKEPAFQENKMTIKELNKLICKGIDSAIVSIDADAVMSAALNRLIRR
jgi:HK97 family phage prohead protease